MAFRNKTIASPATGNQVVFINTGNDTNGQLLEMEATYEPYSKEPAVHYHPHQVEDFAVIAGQLTVRLDQELLVLTEGDTLHIPKNTIHSMWNNSDCKTIVNWKVQPALDTEYFLETIYGLANDVKTSAEGKPNLFQIALLANRFHPVFRLAKPPFIIQRVIFLILTPLAYLFGYRSVYKKYLD